MKTRPPGAGTAGNEIESVQSARQHRQKPADTPVMDTPITSRKHLLDLKKWAVVLNQTWSYRVIASHTWRGKESHGYWQQVAAGEHLKKKPRIRPRWQDWHDLHSFVTVMRHYGSADKELLDRALAVVQARAALDGAVADLLAEVRKRTRHDD